MTKKKIKSIISAILSLYILATSQPVFATDTSTKSQESFETAINKSQELYNNRPHVLRQMEKLNRAPVATLGSDGKVFVSWRFLGTDPKNVAFDIYRDDKKINDKPIENTTNYVDKDGRKESLYTIKTLVQGNILEETKPFGVLSTPYLNIPVGSKDGYVLDEISVGDLDGDGDYEFVLLRKPKDYDPKVYPTTKLFPLYEAHEMDGSLIWTINMGPNFPELTDMNFLVYDFDGDGKAEFVVKTSEGTTDGTGVQIGDTNNDGKTDYRYSFVYNANRQYITEGPEFLSVFDGKTGKELARTNYIERGDLKQWGGNSDLESVHRASQALLTPAYLDGVHPSIVMTRGCWTLNKLKALDYKDGKLTEGWSFDSINNQAFTGQANHNLSVADIDYDGKDEIVWGSAAYDQDGKGLYAYSDYGHGDAMHLGKFLPDHPDIYVVGSVHEGIVKDGLQFREARTGATAFGVQNKSDTGRGIVADIDPRYDGPVLSGAGGTGSYVYDKGKWINWNGTGIPMNFTIYWDGDLLTELADKTSIKKYNSETNKMDTLLNADGCSYINGTKGTPSLQADLLGDWREEYVLPTRENDALRIYTTNIPTGYRISTFMQDPEYRISVAWQNNHYAQPPHVSYFLGHQATVFPIPEIYVLENGKAKYNPDLGVKDINIEDSSKLTNADKTANSVAASNENKDAALSKKIKLLQVGAVLILVLIVALIATFRLKIKR